jgi:hypothetical protein
MLQESPLFSDQLSTWQPTTLPEDFLRLPTTVAVRRTYSTTTSNHHRHQNNNGNNGNDVTTTRYEFLADLERQAVQEYYSFSTTTSKKNNNNNNHHHHHQDEYQFWTVAVERHATLGLGLTLKEVAPPGTGGFGCWQVHGLLQSNENPSALAGIRPLDILIGMNGSAFCSFPTTTTTTTPTRLV